MSSVSDRSAAGSSNGYTRKLSMAMKPTIEIHIDNHYRSKVYTSASTVSGHISINSHRDARFDSIQILFLGNTITRIDGVNIPQATSHTFLKLIMPVPESCYPVPRILEAGRTYIVPFHFVVPRHLTINACNHSVSHDAVRDFHTRLPPTVGFWDRDDLAPDMSRVEYSIKARVLREDDAEGQLVRLFEASQEIRVLPTYAAEPPLGVTPSDKLYTMSKTKTMRKTILSSRLGKVTVSASQPPAVMLSPDGRSAAATTARLDLRFEPAAGASGDCAPPRVTSVSSKITAVTYYSASGMRCLPNLGDWGRSFGYEGSGSYSNTTSLPSSSLAAPRVTWERQRPTTTTTQVRRDSGYGTDAPSDSDRSGEASEEGSSRRSSTTAMKNFARTTRTATKTPKSSSKAAMSACHHYTTNLQVPIQLPIEKKAFLPTFHSCITSRAYVLWLTASLSCGGMSTNVTLGVPLQVGVESADPPAAEDPTGLPSFETALREAEADAYLRPRVMSATPTVQFHHNAALPGYADLMAGRGAGGGDGGGGGGGGRPVTVY